MAARQATVHTLGVLAYPGAQAAAVHGLTDLFETADRLAGTQSAARLEVVQLGARPGKPSAPLTAIVVPPSLVGMEPLEDERTLVSWLVRRHAEGTLLCSVCVGAFLLAETGLLAGRRATTHWALKERFAERFPDIELDTDRLVIDDGDIVTAGGVMAWVDLGLLLVGRFLGPPAMLATARFFLVDPGGREQRFYSMFVPSLTHGDAAVLRTQHWMHANAGTHIGLPALAKRTGLGERTFLRRFQKATGLRPTEYLQNVRVMKARELLELSKLSLDEVAYRVGYEDGGAFRKIFVRVMGLSPAEYRRRFATARS